MRFKVCTTMRRLSPISCVLLVAAPLLADDAAFTRQMNLGKAHLENRESAKAIEILQAAVRTQPDSAPALRNLARAYLLADRMDDAIAALDQAAPLDPDAAATPYLAGIAFGRKSEFEKAAERFELAARLDPHTPAVRFQLALAYQSAGRDEPAKVQYGETTRLDPLHAAAWFKLATFARQTGDQAEAQRCQREFMRLRKLLGEQSRNAESLERCSHTSAEPPPAPQSPAADRPTIDVRFTDATRANADDAPAAFAGVAVIDVDDSGRPRLFAVGRDGTVQLLQIRDDGALRATRCETRLSDADGPFDCIIGNFHDDVPSGAKYDAKVHALNDVLLIPTSGRHRLLKQTARGAFTDVTAAAGLAELKMRHAVWVDADHDGDLDLFIATDETIVLMQNNGNGTFTDVSIAVELPKLDSAQSVFAADFDQNAAIDLLALRGSKPSIVIENQRVGRFARMPDPPGPWPEALAVVCDDFNGDGRIDVALFGESGARIIHGGGAGRTRLDYPGMRRIAATAIDFDNDGRLDLVLAGSPTDGGAARVMAWRNGETAWRDATEALRIGEIRLPEVRALIAADFDGDGDTDVLAHGIDETLRFLRNNGGNQNRQLKLSLITQKTNPSGYGTQVEIRAGEFFTSRCVYSPVIEIGVGKRQRLDTVQTVWMNGVVDNQIDADVESSPLVIIEKNVATGSCPFLYAWDGERFRFVTDLLGNAPVGLPLSRDMLLEADPDEFVVIGPSQSIQPRDGRFVMEVTSEFHEVLYLDAVRLFAVDHESDLEIHVTDKLTPPPFPPSEIWALGHRRAPISAQGSDGVDRTNELREIDGRFAPPGALLPPPYRGMCHPLDITLDFGDKGDALGSNAADSRRRWVLALTGWLQYGQAGANIAMSQNPDMVVIPPRLSVEDADGRWTPIDVVVGMPAGKTKTILVDLDGKLPPGFRRLRLSNTFEIRWDRIALFERRTLADDAIRSAPPIAAEARWRGFSEIRSRAPGHPTTPNYERVFERPPWRSTLEGWCTRYGDMVELIAERDEELAIINGGDAIRIEFDAAAFPPKRDDRARTFLFYSVGWEKDGEYNVTHGNTVEPGPIPLGFFGPSPAERHASGESASAPDGEATAAPERLSDKYNTRWVPRDQLRN